MLDRITGRAHRQHVAALEERITRLQKQRDRLRGRVEDLTRDQRLGYVFVITYGRSGSTLVQGLLNSIPGYLIRGENRQLMRHLWAYDEGGMTERRVQRRKQRKRGAAEGGSEATSPLFGMDNFGHGQALRYARRMAVETILRPEPGTRVTGFKEVEWGEPDTPAYVAWLQRVFPGAKFVINTRDLTDVAQSAWWSENPEALVELQAREALVLGLAETLGDAAFHIRYEDYTADPETLRPLFAWLGEEYDERRVRDVLGTRHSFRPRRERTDSAALGDLEHHGTEAGGDQDDQSDLLH